MVTRWPGRMFCELRFLEVGGDPDVVERHDGEQRLSRLHVHADFDVFVHHAADRRGHSAVLQIQFGLIERGAFLLPRRPAPPARARASTATCCGPVL